MVNSQKPMVGDYPEEKLARRILKKHALTIPVNIRKLIKEYATLIFEDIPIEGVDGVSLHIGIPGKETKVIVNNNIPTTRQLFTMAHELGHIIIPWHIGTLIDNVNAGFYSNDYKDFVYSELEREANRFAAELLIPKAWVLELYGNEESLANVHEKICQITGVSDQAAAIRMGDVLPPNITYCSESNSIIKYGGSTTHTTAIYQRQGERYDKFHYPYFKSFSTFNNITSKIHWWELSTEINLTVEDKRPWREILEEIVTDIAPAEPEKYKKSVNSIIAAANGNAKRDGNYSVDGLMVSIIYRLRRTEYKDFTSHRLFESFAKSKAKDLFNK